MKKAIVLVMMLAFMMGVLLYPAGKGKTTQRNYMLVFEVTEYSSQLKDAVEYFFDKVFQKGDLLIINTPVKLYGYSRAKLAVPRKKLTAGVLKMLKADINAGAAKYRALLEEMRQNVESLSEGGPSGKGAIQSYLQNRQNLVVLRGIAQYETRLLKYSKVFRTVKGENHLLMFLQKEFRPIPGRNAMEVIRQNSSIYGLNAVDAFLGENYKTDIDYQKIGMAFKYANVRFHFLYLSGKTLRPRGNLEYIESLGDLYSIFSKIAKATDGIKLATSKPSAFVKKVELVVEGKVEVEVVDEKME